MNKKKKNTKRKQLALGNAKPNADLIYEYDNKRVLEKRKKGLDHTL